MERKITQFRLIVALLVMFAIQPLIYAQTAIYQHNFGTANITTHPYTVAPQTFATGLSNSSWTNTTGGWTSFGGASGQALSLANSSGTPVITLTFSVATGQQVNITGFDFWRQRSGSGAQNWSMSINGTNVGSGSVPTSGTTIGNTAVTTANGLSGTVTVTITLSGANGSGTFRLDDFTLYGAVSAPCTPPTVTSFFPTSGPANTLVTINGSGFASGSGTSAVYFNGIAAGGFTVVSDTQIKALVPVNGTTGPISLTTNSCDAVASAFTVLSSNCTTNTVPTDIFISEVYDAETGSGGIIEIYNGTGQSVNLSDYSLLRYSDIGNASPALTVNLSGTLANGSVLIVRTTGTVCQYSGAPAAPQILLSSGFNENDEFKLVKNSVVIDNVQFPNETGFTFIRNANAVVPQATYNAADWNISLTESCTNIGTHTITSTPTTQITSQPVSASICEGQSATFSITVSNAAAFSYQWKMLNASGVWVNITNNTTYSGATTATLTVNNAPMSLNGAQFYCEATSTGCTLVSNGAQLTVSPLPVAIMTIVQPTCVTSTGNLMVTPSVGDGLTYSINGTTYQTSALFNNLTPGNYTLYVKSSANCITEMPFAINPVPPTPTAPDVMVTQPTCAVATSTVTVNSPLDPSYTYSINGTDFQTSPTFANVATGIYTVTVMTSMGCSAQTGNITVNAQPATPTVATYTVTQPTCAIATGSIVVSAPTGTGIQYSINGGTTYQTSTTFANLAAGTYTITTQNAAGCTSVTGSITINAAPATPAVATYTVTQPTCAVATGSIVVSAPTGTGIQYSINGGTTYQTSATFANLAAGTYTITTQNAAGCTSVTGNITINAQPATPAVATYTVTQPTCAVATGSIVVTAPTGTGIQYSVNGGTTYQASTTFANLAAGTYTITTQNAAGCSSVTGNITINAAPATPAAATYTVTQPTCAVATGSIVVSAPTGTGIQYSINGGTTYQTSTTFANLAAGTYTITTQNAAGCTSVTGNITINAQPATPAVATYTVTQPTCTVATGSIVVTAPTGTGLQYSVDGGTTYQASATFANLAPGTYTVTTQNAAGCTSVTGNIVINNAPGAPAQATYTVTQPTCAVATGSIVITAPTGAGLQYSINGGTTYQSGTTFANLAAGTYTVTVQNAAGCTSVTANIVIDAQPATPAVATYTVTQASCTTPSGTIVVTAPTGTGIQYSIDGGTTYQSGTTFANLMAGNYAITTQNTDGCTSVTGNIQINAAPAAPATPVLTVIQPNCTNISTGTITVSSPTGNVYTYSIDGTNFQTSPTFSNLAGGSYTATVQNTDGCTASTTVTINNGGTAPAVATTTLTQPSCTVDTGSIEVTAPLGAEYTYSIDGGANYQASPLFTDVTPGAYQITVMNDGGCISTTSQVTINNPPVPPTATVDITQPTCFDAQGSFTVTAPVGSGYTYSIDGVNFQNGTTFINLTAGTQYQLTIQNLAGCTSVTQVNIDVAPVTPVVAKVEITQPTCDTDGGILTVVDPQGSDYIYSIDGTTFQASPVFLNVAPGSYVVTVMGMGGCTSVTSAMQVNAPTGTFAVAEVEGCESTTLGNHYILNALPDNNSFNPQAVTYAWVTTGGVVVGEESSFDATAYVRDNNITSFPFTLNVMVTSTGGCQGTAQFTVYGIFCDVPKGISPNNDGKNDNFDISGMNARKVSIFNRFGQEVYSKANYTNEWYGQSSAGELPSGTYYYVIELQNGNKTGWVYINRENE